MFKRSKRRTQKPLGLYVTRYWFPEIKKLVPVFYEIACQLAMNMRVKNVRVFMDVFYEEHRKSFLDGIAKLQPRDRNTRRVQLLALRAFRNDYRKQQTDFDEKNPNYVSRY